MTHTPYTETTARIQAEPMINSREASVSLQLPFYWLNHRAERLRRGIPHYEVGTLVRFRMSELLAWALEHGESTPTDTDERTHGA